MCGPEVWKQQVRLGILGQRGGGETLNGKEEPELFKCFSLLAASKVVAADGVAAAPLQV